MGACFLQVALGADFSYLQLAVNSHYNQRLYFVG